MSLNSALKCTYALLFAVALACNKKPPPQYLINTTIGNIIVEVYPEKAPLTVANFLNYVNGSKIEDASFYRVVKPGNQPKSQIKIEVIQGNFTSDRNAIPPIKLENTKKTGILHKNGTISMARMEPNSATVHFFICINDQPELDFGGKRNSDGQGFAAFGKIVVGMKVVRKIQQMESSDQILANPIQIISITPYHMDSKI